MQLLALITRLALCAAPVIDVSVSPDQPLPYGYVDDPLVIELRSPADAQLDLSLHAEAPGIAPAVDLKAGPVPLHANAPGLAAFTGLPAVRGLIKGTLTVSGAGDLPAIPLSIARIERPSAAMSPLPVYVHSVTTLSHVLAARAAGAAAVRIDIADPNFEELLRAAAPMLAVPYVRADQRGEMQRLLAAVPADLAHLIVRWIIDPAGDMAALQEMADFVKAAPCKAPIAIMVPDAATFEKLMNEGAGHIAHAAVLVSDVTTGKEARLLLDATERGGYESWPLYVLATGGTGADAPAHALQQVLANLAAGAAGTGVNAGLLYDGTSMGEAFVGLSALQRRIAATQHAGNVFLGTSVSAPLFRDASRWMLAIWSEGTGKEVLVPVNNATNLQLTDPAGNPVTLPALKDGALPVQAGPMPVLLTGAGGPLPGIAARNKVQNTARRLLDDKLVQRWAPQDVRALVQAAADRKGELDRASILALMRALPELERLWHAGQMPRAAATPAIADIARLCRQMSVIEEDLNREYLEPMQDMIARSEEMQSVYLTGAGGGAESHERGDWLLNEVRRLIDEARKLAAEERKVEAAGVAALAEWRARGLEFAATEGDKSRLSEEAIAAAMVTPPPAAPLELATPAAAEGEAAPAPAKVEEEKPAPKADEKLAPGQPKGTRKLMHTVKRGETPESIAKQYGADFEAFRKANGLRRGAALKPGRQYVVYAPAVKEAEAPRETKPEKEAPKAPATEAGQPPNTKKVVHKVGKGDNPSVIAKKYGVKTDDFLKWNKLTPRARFQIGEEYVVFVPAKR